MPAQWQALRCQTTRKGREGISFRVSESENHLISHMNAHSKPTFDIPVKKSIAKMKYEPNTNTSSVLTESHLAFGVSDENKNDNC